MNNGEQCDDGNTTNTDACTNTCQIARVETGVHVSGVHDAGYTEGQAAEDGNENALDQPVLRTFIQWG